MTNITKFFKDETVNAVALKILELESGVALNMQRAHDLVESAFEKRWQCGKLLYDNEPAILAECETWDAFSQSFGMTPSVISNNRRAYGALLEAGCDTWEKVLNPLQNKQIQPTVRNFEKIGSLLAAPTAEESPKDNRGRDEKRLEQIYSELEDIRKRNETANNNSITEVSVDVQRMTKELAKHIHKTDPRKSHWSSEPYLDFVRSMGVDILTGKPCHRPDPHHTDEYGRQGGVGEKLADCFTIPVSRETHSKIESGEYFPTQEELSSALITTMAQFIINHFKE